MYQKIIIVGNLGHDPEMRYTPSGKAVTNFSVAVNDARTTASGERIKNTIWIRVVTWGKTAEACNQYAKKGMKVLVEGRLNSDPATGGPKVFRKQDGSYSAAHEITASMVKFLSSRGDVEIQTGDIQTAASADEAPPEEDIPF